MDELQIDSKFYIEQRQQTYRRNTAFRKTSQRFWGTDVVFVFRGKIFTIISSYNILLKQQSSYLKNSCYLFFV